MTRGCGAVLELLAAASALSVLAACGMLDEPPRSPTSTPVRLNIARVPTSGPPTPTIVRVPTRSAPTPTPAVQDEAQIEQSVADARATVERVLRSGGLPQLETILTDTVALAAPTGGEQLERAAAAQWLRRRATGRIRVTDFQRHQHQALIIASSTGWSVIAPMTTGTLGFTLRRYDAAGAQDPDNGDWLIDVIQAE